MEEAISEYLELNGFTYVPVPDEHLVTVYNLLLKDIVVEVDDGTVLLYCGVHRSIKDYDGSTIKYYKRASDKGNSHAMNNLANCYRYSSYKKALKYYSMSIDCGNYRHVYDALSCIVENNKDSVLYINKVLNKQFNVAICHTVCCLVESVDENLINIIVNIDGGDLWGGSLFLKLKKLVC